MKVISINTNGIRAANRKGFFEWIEKENPDIVCIQETKAQENQLIDDTKYFPQGYHCSYHDAEKKGYSGVAIYSKSTPQKVIKGTGWKNIDQEGRYIEYQFNNINIVSLYMHSGSSGDERQKIKEDFMTLIYQRFMEYKNSKTPYIICGDINIVHTEKDIKNAKGNKNSSGFLPHEREWIGQLFENGYKDAFRLVDNRDDQYTWWSNRGQAWANNVGWRIDYHIIDDRLSDTVSNAKIYKEQRFSDHAPLIIDYNFTIV